jgi:hypothetical protein
LVTCTARSNAGTVAVFMTTPPGYFSPRSRCPAHGCPGIAGAEKRQTDAIGALRPSARPPTPPTLPQGNCHTNAISLKTGTEVISARHRLSQCSVAAGRLTASASVHPPARQVGQVIHRVLGAYVCTASRVAPAAGSLRPPRRAMVRAWTLSSPRQPWSDLRSGTHFNGLASLRRLSLRTSASSKPSDPGFSESGRTFKSVAAEAVDRSFES